MTGWLVTWLFFETFRGRRRRTLLCRVARASARCALSKLSPSGVWKQHIRRPSRIALSRISARSFVSTPIITQCNERKKFLQRKIATRISHGDFRSEARSLCAA
jgi:hypothetical protein